MVNRQLSILIPTYNCDARSLITALEAQCRAVEHLEWEIVLADDASTNLTLREGNAKIMQGDNKLFLPLEKNVGRAAIRNILVKKARFNRLLFIDGDVNICRSDFIACYLHLQDPVIMGGITVKRNDRKWTNNLNYRYECACENNYIPQKQQEKERVHLRSANFVADKTLLLAIPFNEQLTGYGYEDVLLGRNINLQGIKIRHIDNPVEIDNFENNAAFLTKTEEALHNLRCHKEALYLYSRLLQKVNLLNRTGLLLPLKLVAPVLLPLMRNKLKKKGGGNKCFQLYKLLFYINMDKKRI